MERQVKPLVLLVAAMEIEEEIRLDGVTPQSKAWLYHELGTVYGQMGDKSQQKKLWEKALKLDPNNRMIRSSLESLT